MRSPLLTTAFLLALALLCTVPTNAQVIQLGSGTAENNIVQASPVNIYFRRQVARFVYTQAEIAAAGFNGPGEVTKIGWRITGIPIYNIPGYTIRLKHTNQTNVTTNLGNGNWTTVKNAFSYAPTTGDYDMITLDVPFTWNGTNNLAVEICFSQVAPTWDPSGQCRVYTATSGYRYSRDDNTGSLCGSNPGTVVNYKPQAKIIFDTTSVWTGVVSTDWYNDGNWTAGAPDRDMYAVIPSGVPNFPDISTSGAECFDLTINTDATLTTSGTGRLDVYGDWTNNGGYNAGAGTIIALRGDQENQMNGGPQSFSILEVNSYGGAALSSGTYEITDELRMELGDLTTNGLITINSDATSTARVDEMSGHCAYTLITSDSWGDGWNGGFVTLFVDGIAVRDYYCLVSADTFTVPVPNGSSYSLVYTSGTFENENRYQWLDANMTSLFSDGPNPATGTVFTASSACSFENPVLGDLTMQRYIDAGSTNWRFFSSAVNNVTFNDWKDDFVTSGIPGSHFPNWPYGGNPWASIRVYDEPDVGPLDSGFAPIGNMADPIETARGYWVWSGDTISGTQPFLVDVTGSVNAGPINFPVTYTNNSTANVDGWCLVGNPYPSAIDWTSTGVTRVNVDNATYIWDPDHNRYAAYVNGSSANGGNRVIASSQAFWVHANAASPSLSMTERAKIDSDPSYFKAPNTLSPGMSIQLEHNGVIDESVVRTIPNATEDFDAELDAYKIYTTFYGPHGVASLHPQGTAADAAVNSLPIPSHDMVVPVRFESSTAGAMTFSFSRIDEIQASCLRFKDLLLGQEIDLNVDSTYTFTHYFTAMDPRFELHIGALLPEPLVIDPSCFGASDGVLEVSGFGAGPWNVEIYDAQGVLLSAQSNVSSSATFSGLAGGEYTVVADNNGGYCDQRSRSVTLVEPNPLSASAVATDEQLGGDGSIQLLITGGVAPYAVQWQHGPSGNQLTDLFSGAYTATITDANGCTFDIAVSLGSSVGIVNNHQSWAALSLYPNPTDGNHLYLGFGDTFGGGEVSVSIADITGKTLITQRLQAKAGQDLKLLKGETLAPGVYLVILQHGNAQTTRPLVVQ